MNHKKKLDEIDNERIKIEKKAFTAENEVERLLKECTEWTQYKKPNRCYVSNQFIK